MTMSTIKYKGDNSNRGPSPAIWANCPWMEMVDDPNKGVTFYDDFTEFQPLNYATGALQTNDGGLGGKYRAYCATAGTWKPDNMPTGVTGTFGGHISGLCDTDGDSMAIGTSSCPFLLNTAGLAGKLWFEARIATTSIATNMGQIFVGLHENQVTAFSSTCPLGNADVACATTCGVGFQRLEDGLGVLGTTYWDHSATQVAVQASASTGLAANTWIKLGMLFDPDNTSAAIRFFVNGTETTTPVTKAALLALTFLDVSGVGPCLAFYADSAGTADYLYLDWWRCAQSVYG